MVDKVEELGITLPETLQGTVTTVWRVTVVTGTVDAGATVMVLGTLVMRPGFCGMYEAQIPARYESADCCSVLSAPRAMTQAMTLEVKLDCLQKHVESALSEHPVEKIQVLRHLGRRFGQGALGAGAAGPVVGTAAAVEETETGTTTVVDMVEGVTVEM